MSQRVLMEAVRDLLRRPAGAGTAADGLGYAATVCEVMYDGQPPPAAGELFVAVHEGEWRNSQDECRDDFYGVEVTVTRKVGWVPYDRAVVALADATNGLHRILEAIAAKLHSNYTVLSIANGVLGGGVNGFVRPLFFRGAAGRTEVKGPEWFSAEGQAEDAPAGIARTLLFSGAERVQTIESQT